MSAMYLYLFFVYVIRTYIGLTCELNIMKNLSRVEPYDIDAVSKYTYHIFQNLKTTSANPNVPDKIYEMTNNITINKDFYLLANYSKKYTEIPNKPHPLKTTIEQDEIINALDSIGCCIHLILSNYDIKNINNLTSYEKLIKLHKLISKTVKYYKHSSKNHWVNNSIYN